MYLQTLSALKSWKIGFSTRTQPPGSRNSSEGYFPSHIEDGQVHWMIKFSRTLWVFAKFDWGWTLRPHDCDQHVKTTFSLSRCGRRTTRDASRLRRVRVVRESARFVQSQDADSQSMSLRWLGEPNISQNRCNLTETSRALRSIVGSDPSARFCTCPMTLQSQQMALARFLSRESSRCCEWSESADRNSLIKESSALLERK